MNVFFEENLARHSGSLLSLSINCKAIV